MAIVKSILLRDQARLPSALPPMPSFPKTSKPEDLATWAKQTENWLNENHTKFVNPLQQQFRDTQIAVKGLKDSLDGINLDVAKIPTNSVTPADVNTLISNSKIKLSQIPQMTKVGQSLASAQSIQTLQATLQLGSAALKDIAYFATAAQGALADSALQSESDPLFNSWLTGFNPTVQSIHDISIDYSVNVYDYTINCVASPITITIITGMPAGKILIIKNSTIANVTVGSTELIDGLATITVLPLIALRIQFTGTTWIVI